MGCIVNLNGAAAASLRLPTPTEGDKKERGFCCFPRRHRRHHQFRPPPVPTATNSRSHSLTVTNEALNVMISGAPASGKGTQCHLIADKYGLVHIAAGDLLRAEIATGSENGKRAKQYMEQGQLVPDEIVVMMVKDRLLKPDSKERGWLLDGYPRSLSQATALKGFGFEPHTFLLLEVSEDVLVERVVGRRLDPVKLRLNTHHQNVESVLALYEDITVKINGNVSKEEVFAQIDSVLTSLVEQRKAASGSVAA
ncbi:hypothetical protein V8G54_023068 [Vigna mungo]|uniref:adenylate kinase n=1 Tax=Vigna mungo TaxID=3915 RepID=A0AAQ3N3T3_VIGMU